MRLGLDCSEHAGKQAWSTGVGEHQCWLRLPTWEPPKVGQLGRAQGASTIDGKRQKWAQLGRRGMNKKWYPPALLSLVNIPTDPSGTCPKISDVSSCITQVLFKLLPSALELGEIVEMPFKGGVPSGSP